MAASAGERTVLGGFVRLGKYFQFVSIIPAAVVVGAVWFLIASGAPASPPNPAQAVEAFLSIRLGGALALGAIVIVVGVLIHPFQFVATQLLEGYWGASAIGISLMKSRVALHRHRRADFSKRENLSRLVADEASRRVDPGGMSDRFEAIAQNAAIESQQFGAAAAAYPLGLYRVMPTRLGNVLRKYEDLAGRPYGLTSVVLTPHLMSLAPRDQVDYVDDARSDMDLAVRLVVSWLMVAVVSFAFLWTFGAWLLLPVLAYLMAWVSYRGAVAAAEEYGVALQVLFDLNHRILLEGFEQPGPGLDLQRGQELSRLANRQ